jgi:hypothetical protein
LLAVPKEMISCHHPPRSQMGSETGDENPQKRAAD